MLVMKKIWWVVLGLFLVFLFRNLFFGDLAWGDAPFFYDAGLKELLNEPWSWTGRGNNLGGVNQFLFIWPLMVLYGLLGEAGLTNNQILLSLFYLPSIVLSVLGMVLLMRHRKFGVMGQVVAALFYVANTYYLLIIDGGVVGLALAYGIFPWALLLLFRLARKSSYWNFVSVLVVNELLIIADPRAAAMVWLTFVVLEATSYLLRKKKENNVHGGLVFLLIIPILLGLNMYWLWPLIKLSEGGLVGEVGGGIIRFRDALCLYLPHWPENIFGVTRALPVIFMGIPFLVLTSMIFRKNRVVTIMFVGYAFFATLAAGYAPIKVIPFGFAFRDSSKFFIPLALMVGVMVGALVDKVNWKSFEIFVLGYLMALMLPVFRGEMNFVLSDRWQRDDVGQLSQKIENENGEFRTAWFPERNPLTFQTERKPALDGRDLVNLRPLARLNAGEDPYNYLNWNYEPWFDLLGIKYLVFVGSGRSVEGENEWEYWDGVLKENEGILPKVFGVEKLVAVVGSDSLYDQVNMPTPMVFFEDGKFDPYLLNGLPKDSVEILFNKKSQIDLVMSFLQEYFVSPRDFEINDWANYGEGDYLKYKYQLLQRGVAYDDFDYGKGLAFSSVVGEKLANEFKVSPGKYMLGIRQYGGNGYEWKMEERETEDGVVKFEMESGEGVGVVNVVALVPLADYQRAQTQAETFLSHFETIERVPDFEIKKVEYKMDQPFRYELIFGEKVNWVVLADSYNPMWALSRDQLSYAALPAYSMVNIFYKRPEWDNKVELFFTGQHELRWGIYWTALTGLGVMVGLLWFCPRKNDKE